MDSESEVREAEQSTHVGEKKNSGEEEHDGQSVPERLFGDLKEN